jgi:monovalent cation:H+ antiporter-2, CPA2 family
MNALPVIEALAVAGPQAGAPLTDLVLIVGIAALFATVFQRWGLPIVLGYLLAGLLVGPSAPLGLSVSLDLARPLSDIGVILIMFSLGLEFSVRRLIRIAPSGGVVALIECSLVGWLGYISSRMLGFDGTESIFTAAMCAISSTTIIAKTFSEKGLHGRLSELVFGVLVAEDLIAILLLAVLTATSTGTGDVPAAVLGRAAGRLLLVMAGMLIGGMLVIPRLVRFVARAGRSETLVMSCLAIASVLAYLSQKAGYSVAFGAFLAGALVAESGEAKVAERLIRPIRDIFAGVFFVSVGMLLDLAAIRQHLPAVLVLTVVVVVGKLVAVTVGAFVAGNGTRLSIQAGMSLGQIGEFSFILAGVGSSAGVLRSFLFPVAIAVSALTTLLTPFMIRGSAGFAATVDRRLPHAVQTYAALYGSWVQALGEARRRPTEWSRIRRLARFLFLDVVIIAGIVIATSLGQARVSGVVLPGRPTLARALVTAAAIGLALPFFVGALRVARRLGLLLAEGAFPRAADGVDLADAPRRALRATLELAILFAAGAPLVALTQPFLPAQFPFGAALIVGVALLALPFWRSATNLQGHVRAGAQLVLEALVAQSRSHQPGPSKLEELRSMMPGMGEPTAFTVAAGASCIGRSLKQLNLRGLTGATVLAIERGNGDVVVPSADETLREHDVLVLTGTHEAVHAACELLRHSRRPSLATSDGDLLG